MTLGSSCLMLLLLNFLQVSDSRGKEESMTKPSLKCKGLWRPDHLVGKCFGLTPYSEISELKDIKNVTSSMTCRTLCCNMGEKCITWQYQQSSHECKLGGVVRLGLEVTGTPDWCDPFPPGVWNGKRLKSKKDGVCTWGESLPTQCFGLGPEILTEDKKQHSTQSCEEACCSNKDCEMWQEMAGRGCYFASSKGVWCDVVQGKFDGARKCVPGYCGGMEDKILPAYYKILNSTLANTGKAKNSTVTKSSSAKPKSKNVNSSAAVIPKPTSKAIEVAKTKVSTKSGEGDKTKVTTKAGEAVKTKVLTTAGEVAKAKVSKNADISKPVKSNPKKIKVDKIGPQ